MASREKEVMLKIIEVYKEMPFLWNKRHEDYKNSRSRHKGQQILLDIYKIFDPNATMQTMMKRLHNLRSYYVAELKKVKESIQNGGAIYVPHIYYYDAFSFLDPCLESSISDSQEFEHMEPIVSINTDDDANTIISAVKNQAKEIIQEMLVNSPTNNLRRKYLKEGPEEKRSRTSGANTCNLGNRNRQSESLSALSDEFQIFGLYVTTQLKSLSEEQSLIAREKIQTILFQCRLQDIKRKNASSENDATSTGEMRNVHFVSVNSNAKKTKISSSNLDAETDSDSDTDILKDNFIVQVVGTKGDATNVDSQSLL